MEFKLILVLLNVVIYLIVCEISVDLQIENVTSISKVLHDVVNKFLISENIKFNVRIFNKITQFQQDILTDFLSNNEEKFDYRLFFDSLQSYQNEAFMELSNIFVIRALEDILFITKAYTVIRHANQPIKYFALIPFFTFEQLKASWICTSPAKLTAYSGTPVFYTYFITNEFDTVTLSTIEWFSPFGCQKPHLHKLNSFSKKSMKWSTKLVNYEKFLNYYGCELVMMLPVVRDANYHHSGYALLNWFQTEMIEVGISPAVFKISSKFHNFSVAYQPVKMQDGISEYFYDRQVKTVPVNGNDLNLQILKYPEYLSSLFYSNRYYKNSKRLF